MDTKQVGGIHYQMPIEPWDYVCANNLGYLEGNVIKYISRWKAKDGLQDLLKAQHYIEKLIKVENDRLLATHAASGSPNQGNTIFIVTQSETPSPETMSGIEYRKQQVDQCRVKYAGYGQPVSLGDII